MRLSISILCGSFALAALSCRDEVRGELPQVSTSPSPVQADAGLVLVAECDQAANGTPCGKPGAGTHCIFNACVRNACGDGVKTDDEECDDGDEFDGDGCDARCRFDIPGCPNGKKDGDEECDDGNRNNADGCTNRCTTSRCGDGIIAANEDCDDGNRVDSDMCTNRCTNARCGDGIQGPGEDCDDGNVVDLDECTSACKVPVRPLLDAGMPVDAGTPGMEAGMEAGTEAGPADAGVDASDAKEASDADAMSIIDVGLGTDAGTGSTACDECRKNSAASQCVTDDLARFYDGCLRAVNGDYADTADPLFLQQCIDIVQCARTWRCAYNLDLRPYGGQNYKDGTDGVGALGCYCGAKSLDACLAGPAPDAKCRAQWEAGARSTVTADVLANISDLKYPAAWAFSLLACDRSVECDPFCVPK